MPQHVDEESRRAVNRGREGQPAGRPCVSDDPTTLFRDLFVSCDAYYAVQMHPRYRRGYIRVNRRLSNRAIRDHLAGKETIGLYYGQLAKTTCIDIDTLADEEVRKVNSLARDAGIQPLWEMTGGRGYHGWILYQEPIPLAHARAVGLAITDEWEVWPKQTAVDRQHPGNLIKAPLGKHQAYEGYAYFFDLPFRPVLDPFTYLASFPRVDGHRFVKRLGLEDKMSVPDEEAPLTPARGPPKESYTPCYFKPCVSQAIGLGAPIGKRNMTGFIVATECKRLGHSYERARSVMSDFNRSCEQPLPEEEIETILKSAYSQHYEFGCSAHGSLRRTLDNCCGPENCHYFKATQFLQANKIPMLRSYWKKGKKK